MKKIRIIRYTALLTLFCVACATDDFPTADAPGQRGPLTVELTGRDYAPAGSPSKATRAQEVGLATQFTAGDRAGVFIVKDGKLLGDNICITCLGDGTWDPVGIEYVPSADYFVYYPWRETFLEDAQVAELNKYLDETAFTDILEKNNPIATFVNPEATDADGFFEKLHDAWWGYLDQSDYARYTASDLMFGKGEVSEAGDARTLRVSMEHTLPLIIFEYDCQKSFVADDGFAYTTPNLLTEFRTDPLPEEIPFRPCALSAGNYRMILSREMAQCVNEQNIETLVNAHLSSLRYWVAGGEKFDLTDPANADTAEFWKDEIREYTIPTLWKFVTEECPGNAGEYHKVSITVGSTVTSRLRNLRIGDLYYADGTILPAEIAGKMEAGTAPAGCVGVVFQTDPGRIGAAEKAALGGEAHGLVIALKNAAAEVIWGPDNIEEGLAKSETKAQTYKDISGYGNCAHIRRNRGSFNDYPAFKATEDYNVTCPVPATTTGWYLPASGQCWDLLQNLGGCPALADPDEQTSSDSSADTFKWSEQGDIPAVLNAWMAIIADRNKNSFGNCYLWSSSAYTDAYAWVWTVDSGSLVFCHWLDKGNGFVVRPVLAF